MKVTFDTSDYAAAGGEPCGLNWWEFTAAAEAKSIGAAVAVTAFVAGVARG